MKKKLKAVVIGAGWAGEGHTRALRYAGVDVVAICARKSEVVRAVADRLQVSEASVDWRRTVEQVRPDIVSLATPAALRGEVIEVAVEMGCHILCDKPLATTAGEAKRLYQLVQKAGIKHAYAATHRYDPSVAWIRELIRNDSIGALREIVVTCRVGFPALMPWSWMQSLAAGGGVLNNLMPHLLGILETVVGGEVVRVMGEARISHRKAPVLPDIHDFRDWMKRIGEGVSAEEAKALEWRDCDAETAFSALMGFRSSDDYVHVTVVYGSGIPVAREATGMRLYGDKGTLTADGLISYRVSRKRASDNEPDHLETPQRLRDALPKIGDHVQNKWCMLARDFVSDICGNEHQPYLTFRDGWRYQEVIDAIRNGRGWYELPS